MKNKKNILIGIIGIICIVGIVTLIEGGRKKYDFLLNITTNTNEVNIGDELIIQIKADKNVVASNFEINYDNNYFELIDSNTENLFVSEKNGKIACIYFDINQKGIDTFEIKFKATNNKGQAKFSLDNTKFRVIGQDESYVDEQIKGLNKIVNVNVK